MIKHHQNPILSLALYFGLASAILTCQESTARAGGVQVAAAHIEYNVPGEWDISGEKPVNTEHVCYPQLTYHHQKEMIVVVIPSMEGKTTLESVVSDYASFVEKAKPLGKCEITRFVSDYKVNGSNLYFKADAPETGDPTVIVNSVYVFLNHLGEPVFVRYIATEALFRKEIDEAIKKSLNCVADGKK